MDIASLVASIVVIGLCAYAARHAWDRPLLHPHYFAWAFVIVFVVVMALAEWFGVDALMKITGIMGIGLITYAALFKYHSG